MKSNFRATHNSKTKIDYKRLNNFKDKSILLISDISREEELD